MANLKLNSPAKINLYLHITGKRPDNYHLIDSIITFININDQMLFEPSKENKLIIEGQFSEKLSISDNIILKAIEKFNIKTGKNNCLNIKLIKNIPVGAGLGGGSSNAATTLIALNKLYKTNLSINSLKEIGLELGADVPIFIEGITSYVSGIGEVLENLSAMPKLNILLVNPGKHLATKDVFYRLDEIAKPAEFTKQLSFNSQTELVNFLLKTDNQLEQPAIAIEPVIKYILKTISLENGCQLAKMSGSGATCFGIFENKKIAEKAAENIRKNHPLWFIQTTETIFSVK